MLERVALAKARILSVLDRETVAHQKTLEQKIADQGPSPQRVDPHLIGYAIMDMQELNRIKKVEHRPSRTKNWCANIGTPDAKIEEKLNTLGPLYAYVSGGGFGNLTGDALEIVAFKCLKQIADVTPRFAYQGHFYLDQPKKGGRFVKVEPPQMLLGGQTAKRHDFLQFGYDDGTLGIECKNFREWLYPSDQKIKDLITKSYEMQAIPVIIDRRIHYSTQTNLLAPAGIIAHESYYQYYPSDKADVAEQVRHKRSLGFTDVRATEEPDPRTVKFFQTILPKIVPPMAALWRGNRQVLYDYAKGDLNLAQLYTAIGSPAGGKWVEQEDEEEEPPYDFFEEH